MRNIIQVIQKKDKLLIAVLCFSVLSLTLTIKMISHRSSKGASVTSVKKGISNQITCKLLNHLAPPVHDFVNFPCLKHMEPSKGLFELAKCVRTINLPTTFLNDAAGCVTLKFGRGTPICTYPPEEDVHVSRAVVHRGFWEEQFVQPMLAIFQRNPSMVFLDLGCNIGVYTLAAAQYAKKIFSVDANFENLYLVSRSLVLGNLSEKVTLIWNALSDKHESVVLRKQEENVGGAEIDKNDKTVKGCDLVVNTIVLDDIKEYFRNEEVYIKMDVQSVEHHVLRYGREFFSIAKVRYVQLEYVMHIGLPSGKEIIAAMLDYGFLPFIDCIGSKRLDPELEHEWPGDNHTSEVEELI